LHSFLTTPEKVFLAGHQNLYYMKSKSGIGSLLLLGAAAFGAYKYSKMTDQQKKDLVNKGKKLVDDNLGSLTNMFGKKQGTTTAVNGTV
jgi:hypothetical protein